jgi:hypothetical protein
MWFEVGFVVVVRGGEAIGTEGRVSKAEREEAISQLKPS